MAELLLVRSGESEAPVTKRLEIGLHEFEQSVGNRELRYLGTDLPPIGETSRLSAFSSPDHVVLNVELNETKQYGLDRQGFYLVEDLSLSRFMEA